MISWSPDDGQASDDPRVDKKKFIKSETHLGMTDPSKELLEYFK